MGIYYQAPQPHIGGRQPLEPPRLAPSITAVPVDDPPFSHSGRPGPQFWNILRTWDALPSDPQRGGIYLIQPAAAPGDNPPFGIPIKALWNILRAWDPEIPKTQSSQITAALPGWSVDNPPPVNKASFLNILRSWDALPSDPQRGGIYLIQPAAAPSEDNPPFGIPIRALWNILRAWDPEIPKTQSSQITAALPGWSVDHPPVKDIAHNAILSILIQSWDPSPYLFQKSIQMVSPIAAPSVDNPPWGIRLSLWTILDAWKGEAPVLRFPSQIIFPGIPIVPVSIRQRIIAAMDTRLKSITTPETYNSIRQQIIDAMDLRFRAIITPETYNSVWQRILDAMDLRFKSILISGGYAMNLGNNVFAWRSTPLQASELPGLVYRDRTENKNPGMGICENVMPVEIEIYGSTPEEIRECLAELEKAVESDPRWGGLALLTELDINEMEIEQNENIFCASRIVMRVQYRTLRGNPYIQI